MSVILEEKQPGQTFLKSTSHIRVLDKRGNYLRSVAVGLQFGVVHFPGEIVAVVLWPLIANLVGVLYVAVSNLYFVIRGAVEAIFCGFAGRLEAVDEIEEDEEIV